MNLDSNMGAKLRAPGDEWSLPPDAKYRVVTRAAAACIGSAFIKLDPMQMMACLSN